MTEPKYLFSGVLQSGDSISFYSDRRWAAPTMGGKIGPWGEDGDSLLIADYDHEELTMAVEELQLAYRQWRAKMARVIVALILS